MLWTKAILTAEGRAPSWLMTALKKHSPGLIGLEASTVEPGLLALRLQEWIHGRVFGQAKEDGWLDSLIFFGVRDLRSQAAWAYWEHCEREWERRRPRSFPTFEKWWQTARQYQFCEKASTARIATALKKYVELQGVAYWLHPLLQANRELPATVAAEPERRCPGFLHALVEQEAKGGLWGRLAGWIEDHHFVEAKEQGWFDIVVQQARNDPYHVRLREFSKRSNQSGCRESVSTYPSFDQWQRVADSYVET